ncbi:hypothetical protein S40288_04636 [Stachybotrys chartarum IBT 40288]|nr:hypothetical protein S40288_04636 [Stachybotrys chartarum IBT 40288]
MSDDDKELSLRRLKGDHGASIVSQLVRIGSKRNQQSHEKFLDFIRSLKCLNPQDLGLRRCEINASDEPQYVALSYTWTPSSSEDQEPGHHVVEGWDNENPELSPVRACVLDRALRYMYHNRIGLLWIDAHCIRQDTCDVDDCVSHSQCDEKRDALQAMDFVYQYSDHPVALLGRPLKDELELHLLTLILEGDLVYGDKEEFWIPTPDIDVAKTALGLLIEMTQDSWWRRPWTFQENYRGGKRMDLLIRHDESLEPRKQQLEVFGDIPGELCIKSVKFSKQVTRLCLALKELTEPDELLSEELEQVKDVLLAAGRYKLSIEDSSSMTPRVVADIEARGLSKPWDRLAIVANCCQYPVRLNSGELSRHDQSLSLSVLAMCLLNGEILDNSKNISVAKLTPSECLEKLMYRGLKAPEHYGARLSYNKGCRLRDAVLTAGGIVAKGHLWELGRTIDTRRFTDELPWVEEAAGQLDLYDRKRLQKLAEHLDDLQHSHLAGLIGWYLDKDAAVRGKDPTFTEWHLHNMAVDVVAAISARRKLILGSLRDKLGVRKSYSAVFVLPDDSPSPAFAFTSMWPADPGSEEHDANDVDHHVSLEVKKEHGRSSAKPQLRVGRWMPGMCFFSGCGREEVVFPWPPGLLRV